MFNCKYCNKECKNLNSLHNHENLCKENPNHKESNFIKFNKDTSRKHSNQYIKAKEEGREIIVSDETRKKCGETFKGKHHSEETKQKISKSRKQYLNEHPDKVGFIINHSSKQSYPEKYFEELFIKENIPLKYHKQIDRYELDFYNEDLMKYVEIDGEQHYSDYMIQHDKERNEYLKQKGWKGIRIRWSEYQKMNNDDKYKVINNIKEFINCSHGV